MPLTSIRLSGLKATANTQLVRPWQSLRHLPVFTSHSLTVWSSLTKVEAIRRFGSDVRFHGNDSAITETYARNYTLENDMVYISPYNDLQVIGGQGTIAVELIRQLDKVDAIFVPVGGGGMISGIAGYLKSIKDDVKVSGCLPENSPVMAESVKANQIVEMESLPTLSDGTAGGLEPNAITLTQTTGHETNTLRLRSTVW